MEQRTSAGTGTGGGASQGGGIVNGVKERATAQLSTQKGRATDSLDVIAHAVRSTTQQLRTDQHDTLAQYVERAADQLERLSSGLRDRDVNELLRDAQQFARRQPALFIGGSFMAGLLAARFLKSSRQNASDEEHASSYGSTDEHGRTYGSPEMTASRPADYRSNPAERY